MNFKKLLKRKLFLENMLRAARELPISYAHRPELIAKVLYAVALEKRGEHGKVDALIRELEKLVEQREEELGT